MQRMRRIGPPLLIVGALSLVGLTGCGNKPAPTPPPSTTQAVATPTPAPTVTVGDCYQATPQNTPGLYKEVWVLPKQGNDLVRQSATEPNAHYIAVSDHTRFRVAWSYTGGAANGGAFVRYGGGMGGPDMQNILPDQRTVNESEPGSIIEFVVCAVKPSK